MLISNWKNILKVQAVVVASILIASCTGKGSISSASSGGTSSLTLSAIYPSSQGISWTPVTSGGRIYILGLSLSIYGTCSSGINVVHVNEGGADYPETATCQADGSFTWSKTYAAGAGEGDKTLNVTAYDLTNTIIPGAAGTAQVRVDATPPAVPVITLPGGSPYTYTGGGSTYDITGSCSADTDHLTGPGGGVIACSGLSWSYLATLVDGASLNFTFYSWDLAGNQSAGVTQTIIFTPNIVPIVAGLFPGAVVTDAGSTDTLESSVQALYPGQVSDPVSTYLLDPGPNYATNSARAN